MSIEIILASLGSGLMGAILVPLVQYIWKRCWDCYYKGKIETHFFTLEKKNVQKDSKKRQEYFIASEFGIDLKYVRELCFLSKKIEPIISNDSFRKNYETYSVSWKIKDAQN